MHRALFIQLASDGRKHVLLLLIKICNLLLSVGDSEQAFSSDAKGISGDDVQVEVGFTAVSLCICS